MPETPSLPGLRIAAGRTDITPCRPVPLAGYAGRAGPFERVADPLEINGILLSDGGRRIAILTADLLYTSKALRQAILRHAGQATDGVELLLAASHTHFAPATDPEKPRLGAVDPEYLEMVAGRGGALLRRLAEAPGEPAELRVGTAAASHAVNRRLIEPELPMANGQLRWTVRFAPNPAGDVDQTIRCLRWVDPSGRTLAVLWNYACHPVAFPDPAAVSADYPGVVRARLREAVDPGRRGEEPLPVLFLLGFAGTARPWPGAGSDGFARFPAGLWENWSSSLAERVLAALPKAATLPAGSPDDAVPLAPADLGSGSAEQPLSLLFPGADPDKTVGVRLLRLASGWLICALSAEVPGECQGMLEEYFAGVRLIPVSCADEVSCYLPTDRIVAEGGYEADGFRPFFGLPDATAEGVDGRLLDMVAAAAGGLPDAFPIPKHTRHRTALQRAELAWRDAESRRLRGWSTGLAADVQAWRLTGAILEAVLEGGAAAWGVGSDLLAALDRAPPLRRLLTQGRLRLFDAAKAGHSVAGVLVEPPSSLAASPGPIVLTPCSAWTRQAMTQAAPALGIPSGRLRDPYQVG